jgi:hypothetical protein
MRLVAVGTLIRQMRLVVQIQELAVVAKILMALVVVLLEALALSSSATQAHLLMLQA